MSGEPFDEHSSVHNGQASMSEGNTVASVTYRRAVRRLRDRLILNKASTDVVDVEDMVDLMSALGFQMKVPVPTVSEMMETDELDTIHLEFHCNHSGYVAVLEKDGCPVLPPQDLCFASTNPSNPISGGVSLMVEQVMGKCLHITSILNDIDNHQPMKRRQSAEILPSAKLRQQIKPIRRSESVSTLSREDTFVVPLARQLYSNQKKNDDNDNGCDIPLEGNTPTSDYKVIVPEKHAEIFVDPEVISKLNLCKTELAGIKDKLKQNTPFSKVLSEGPGTPKVKLPTLLRTTNPATRRTADSNITQRKKDTPRPDKKIKF